MSHYLSINNKLQNVQSRATRNLLCSLQCTPRERISPWWQYDVDCWMAVRCLSFLLDDGLNVRSQHMCYAFTGTYNNLCTKEPCAIQNYKIIISQEKVIQRYKLLHDERIKIIVKVMLRRLWKRKSQVSIPWIIIIFHPRERLPRIGRATAGKSGWYGRYKLRTRVVKASVYST